MTPMKLLSLVVAGWLGLGVSPAWALVRETASCPDGQVLKKIGTAVDALGAGSSAQPEQLVNGPIGIDAYSFQCTGSACTVGFYDGDVATDEVETADVAHEDGAAASGGDMVRLDDQLYFADGVTAFGTNLSGVMVYTCQPR